jgi:hypothetical protein
LRRGRRNYYFFSLFRTPVAPHWKNGLGEIVTKNAIFITLCYWL